MTTFDERHPDHLVRINKLGVTCVEDECTGEFISWHAKVAEKRCVPSVTQVPAVGPCPCECNANPPQFCGGCGHAGCGGRR